MSKPQNKGISQHETNDAAESLTKVSSHSHSKQPTNVLPAGNTYTTDSVNAFKSDDRQSQWKIMIMNTSGKKNVHKWEQIPYQRQQVVIKALSKEDPGIVLFQECPCEHFQQYLQEDKTLHNRYKYKGHAKGASMIYKKDIFIVEELSQNTITNILSSEKLAGEKSGILKKILSAECMYISIVKLKNDIDIEFVCVSWHGPHEVTHSTKIKYFTYFMEFLVQLQKEIEKEKKGKKLPILVGGNFNIDINDAKFETEESNKLIFLMFYKVSTRKVPFNGKKASCKNFFVTTEDLKLETIGCMDLKEIKYHVTPETIFDHAPVLGYLSLSDNLLDQLQKARVTDDQTILHHATNESNMCTTYTKMDSQKDAKPVDKSCKIPIMIMNTGRKTETSKTTSYRQMQLIKNVVLSEVPSIALFQEFPSRNFKLDSTWQEDRILSRYMYKHNKGKRYNTGIMYNQDMCVVKELPQEIENHLISLFEEDVKTRFKEKVKKNMLPPSLKPAERMFISKVKTLSEPHVKCVCLSWHGPHNNLDDQEKIVYIKCFMKFLQLLHKDIDLPVLVGGDFNININDFESEVEKEFCIWGYEAPKHRQLLPTSTESLKVGRKSGLIDFFITTKELQLQEIGFKDLNKLNDFFSPEKILSNDPVVGHLRWNKSTLPVKKYARPLISDITEDVSQKSTFVKSIGNSKESVREFGGGKMNGGRSRTMMKGDSGGYPARGHYSDTDRNYDCNNRSRMQVHRYPRDPYYEDCHRSLLPEYWRSPYNIYRFPRPRPHWDRYSANPYEISPSYGRSQPTCTTPFNPYNSYQQQQMHLETPGRTSQSDSSLYLSNRPFTDNQLFRQPYQFDSWYP